MVYFLVLLYTFNNSRKTNLLLANSGMVYLSIDNDQWINS